MTYNINKILPWAVFACFSMILISCVPCPQQVSKQVSQPVIKHKTKKIVHVATFKKPVAPKKAVSIPAQEFNKQVKLLANNLVKRLPKDAATGPIIVTTFVDLNNFYRTCPLGRLITEELIGELQRKGLDVIEMRRSNAIFVKQRFGEFALSRDVHQLAKKWKVRYIVVGTYFEKGGVLILNTRLVSRKTNEIFSSASTTVAITPFMASLLTPTTLSSVEPMSTIKIKSLDSILNKPKQEKSMGVTTLKLNVPDFQQSNQAP